MIPGFKYLHSTQFGGITDFPCLGSRKGGYIYFANDMYNIAIKIVMQGPRNSPVIEKTGRMKEDGVGNGQRKMDP